MEEIVKIKCPNCAAVLSVRYQEGIESKSVVCPICKQRSPYAEFLHPATAPAAADSTCLPEMNSGIGELCELSTGRRYSLSEGRNVIGRQASASTADVQIATGNSMRMSREHLVIDVKKHPVKGYVHVLSLYKEKVNPTSVNGQPLEYNDSVVLSSGSVIDLPDVRLIFTLPDVEGTRF